MAHLSTMGELGSFAPKFNLKNFNPRINKENISIDSLETYPALLVTFFCNHCPYVIHIRDSFINFANEFNKKGLALVAINSNDIEEYPEDSPEKMAEDALKYSYPFPYLYDESQEVAKKYSAVCTPDFFGYNKNSELQYRGRILEAKKLKPVHTGETELRKAMKLIAETGKGPQKQFPSMGCSIKWFK